MIAHIDQTAPLCQAPISEETLLDYWTHDLVDGGESDRGRTTDAVDAFAAHADIRRLHSRRARPVRARTHRVATTQPPFTVSGVLL